MTPNHAIGYYHSPIGWIEVQSTTHAVISIAFRDEHSDNRIPSGETPAVITEMIDHMKDYFAGSRAPFSIAYTLSGTAFQQCVWQAIRAIPFGETRSYSELASTIGRPKATRAVGAACGQNPLPLLIPCHRVIGKTGTLTGFAGGLHRKHTLLQHESSAFLFPENSLHLPDYAISRRLACPTS